MGLVLALLFGASLTADAFGWHRCPHHGGAEGTEASSRPPPVATFSDREDDGPSDRSPAGCTCIGSCHGGAAVPLISSAPTAALADPALHLRSVPTATRRPARERPAYFLPFPHGPPALG